MGNRAGQEDNYLNRHPLEYPTRSDIDIDPVPAPIIQSSSITPSHALDTLTLIS